MKQLKRYTGKVRPKEGGEKDRQGQLIFPYLPSDELVEAVNLAIYLKRPLLLKGVPGCGKTELAIAVAYELNLPYHIWPIKSITNARDGLYFYDAVARLRDAQLTSYNRLNLPSEVPEINPSSYIKWGPLGEAFRSEIQTVVLIDEIDKADLDFPNDLLMELDRKWFRVEETGERVTAKEPPIIIITSNNEKELPDAFLRRCLFHYIEFPQEKELQAIINSRFPQTPERLVNKAIEKFLDLRKAMEKKNNYGAKIVSTSELIDWFQVLKLSPEATILAKLEETLPYPGVLLKSREHHRLYGK
ncbi:MAG TPA: MoxR family ATPase [Cyanothece sp. UBA12306]|nr:MoxR family ATPase [Cyanothece sp. UBA12306]